MLDTSAEILTCRIRDIEKQIEAECRRHRAKAKQFLAGMKSRRWIYR